MSNLLNHYTKISSLKCILESNKMRFTRLDCVDDREESELFMGVNFSKFIFISCWSQECKESIPQWEMYGDKGKGVMITLPEDMFEKKWVSNQKEKGISIIANAMSMFSPQEIMTDNYFIYPSFLNNEEFCQSVNYVDNVEEMKSDIEKICINRDSTTIEICEDKFRRAISLKRTDWSFQKEKRFHLVFFPRLGPKPTSVPDEYFEKMNIHNYALSLLSGKGVNFKYFDVRLDSDALNQIIVTLGYRCSSNDYEYVENLLKQHSLSFTLNKSRFSNTIR